MSGGWLAWTILLFGLGVLVSALSGALLHWFVDRLIRKDERGG
jgi:hypothetical protein